MSHPDDAIAFDDEELLGLRVVVMVPARYTGPSSRDEDLAEVFRFDELGQSAALVGFDFKMVLSHLRGHVRQVRCVKLLV